MRTIFNFLLSLSFLVLGFYFYQVYRVWEKGPAIYVANQDYGECGTFAPAGPHSKLGADQLVKYEAGETLFKANCGSCHAPKRNLTGPAIHNVAEKYEEDMEFLYAWIRNSPALIAEGDPKAVALSQWGPGVMQAFPTLSDQQIDQILTYLTY